MEPITDFLQYVKENIKFNVGNYFFIDRINRVIEFNHKAKTLDTTITNETLLEKLSPIYLQYNLSKNVAVSSLKKVTNATILLNDVVTVMFGGGNTVSLGMKIAEKVAGNSVLFLDLSADSYFNFQDEFKVFQQVMLLDEFFIRKATTRMYKIDNHLYFFTHAI